MREFFLNRSFMEVSTPIIGSVAGGAVARPFYTSATEFPERQLSLRIAPELWLKRLVVGGFDKVFEIGPSFRNEGMPSAKCERQKKKSIDRQQDWTKPTTPSLQPANFTTPTPILKT